jgi:Xaa-Pro aminopeptidase
MVLKFNVGGGQDMSFKNHVLVNEKGKKGEGNEEIEYFTKLISETELKRRQKAVRSMMKEKGIDLLLIQSVGNFMGGYVRYLTNYPSNFEVSTLLFSADEGMGMTLIGHRPPPPQHIKSLYGIEDWRGVELNSSLSYEEDAKVVALAVKEKKPNVIGLVGFPIASLVFYEQLLRTVPGSQIIDATPFFHKIMMVKSEEEIKLIEKSAATVDAGFEAALKAIKPGRKEHEVKADIQREVLLRSSEAQLIGFASAPPDIPCTMRFPETWSRTLKDGDVCTLMIECSGVGGYFTEVGRHICLGKIPKELEEAFNLAMEAQQEIAKMLRPGISMIECWNKFNEIVKNKGVITGAAVGHGQGLNVLEKPMILPDETVEMEANVNMAIHPSVIVGKSYAWICDNYLVTDTEAKRLHKIPQQIFVV